MKNKETVPIWPGWKTVRLIGRGSFGTVYEIQRDMLGETEKAALKVISIPQNDSDIGEMYSDGYDDESITSTFQEHLKSIIAEYSLMRKLNGSANVVNCDDVSYVQHEDGFGWDIFIKMELLTPLVDALPSDISEAQVIKIARDIGHALVQCKQFGIVHRDIKPQNIFVSPLGDYKLGDFGIAKTVEKTIGGTKIGTYKYMAPEVYNNQPYGAGADIYSLGLVLYWLLNERRMPFLPLPPEKLRAGLEEQARLRRFNGEQIPAPVHGSDALKRIVLKACAYDPKERYQSAAEMLNDLNTLNGETAKPPFIPISGAQEKSEDGKRAEVVFPDGEKPKGGSIQKAVDTLPEKDEDSSDKDDGVTMGVFYKDKKLQDKRNETNGKKKAWRWNEKWFIASFFAVLLIVCVFILKDHLAGHETDVMAEPSVTAAPEPTPIPTQTPEPTPTPTQTPESTPTPTQMPEPTPTPMQTPESTSTPTQIPEQTPNAFDVPANPSSPYGIALRENLIYGIDYSDVEKVNIIGKTFVNRKTSDGKHKTWYFGTYKDNLVPGYRLELYYADGLLFFANATYNGKNRVTLYYWGDQLIACRDMRGANKDFSYAGSDIYNAVLLEFGDVYELALQYAR